MLQLPKTKMKLLPYIFLVAINGYQLTWQNVSMINKILIKIRLQADSLLKNGIRGNQCGNPNIGSRKRRSTATRSRNRPEILGQVFKLICTILEPVTRCSQPHFLMIKKTRLSRNKRNRPLEDWSHGHEMVLAMNQGKFKSCTPTSFSKYEFSTDFSPHPILPQMY